MTGVQTCALPILPVSFISFTAALKNSDAQLNWKTAFEQNVSGYRIQRSFDGVNYNTIASVKANGSNSYNFNDISVSSLGVNKIYYLIEEYDLDGKTELSSVQTVDIITVLTKLFVYPNPANDFINVRIPQTISSGAMAVLYNMNGIAVLRQNVSALQYEKISVNKLANGNYSLVIMDNGKAAYQQTVLVQH